MPRIEIDAVEWNEANEEHATRHGVSVREIETVLGLSTTAHRNRRDVDGTTLGGRVVRVVFAYRSETRTARPIAAWEVDR